MLLDPEPVARPGAGAGQSWTGSTTLATSELLLSGNAMDGYVQVIHGNTTVDEFISSLLSAGESYQSQVSQ